MQQSAKDFYRLIFDFNMELQELLIDLKQQASAGDQTLAESADYAFAVDQSHKMLEEILKHVNQLKTVVDKVLCLKYMLQGSGNNVKTEYTTATPTMAEMPRIPARAREPEEYSKMLIALGADPEQIKNQLGDHGVLRPHWPSLLRLIAKRHEEGKPLPPGCDAANTYPIYSVKFRKNKGVLED